MPLSLSVACATVGAAISARRNIDTLDVWFVNQNSEFLACPILR